MYVCMYVCMNTTLFWNTSLPITLQFLGRDASKHPGETFAWRHEVCRLNHFLLYMKFNHFKQTNLHVVSINMKFKIVARIWKFKEIQIT